MANGKRGKWFEGRRSDINRDRGEKKLSVRERNEERKRGDGWGRKGRKGRKGFV